MCLRDHTSKSLNVKQMVILALQVVINSSVINRSSKL